MFFFFQAEDGIRYLVRSRGLGDVYKRQTLNTELALAAKIEAMLFVSAEPVPVAQLATALDAVSYTHLTLPTSDLV